LPNCLHGCRRFLHDDVRFRPAAALEASLAYQDFPVGPAGIQFAPVCVDRQIFRLHPAPFDNSVHHPTTRAANRDDDRHGSPSLHGQHSRNRDSSGRGNAADVFDFTPIPGDPHDTTGGDGYRVSPVQHALHDSAHPEEAAAVRRLLCSVTDNPRVPTRSPSSQPGQQSRLRFPVHHHLFDHVIEVHVRQCSQRFSGISHGVALPVPSIYVSDCPSFYTFSRDLFAAVRLRLLHVCF
jgi:hypothetical protein